MSKEGEIDLIPTIQDITDFISKGGTIHHIPHGAALSTFIRHLVKNDGVLVIKKDPEIDESIHIRMDLLEDEEKYILIIEDNRKQRVTQLSKEKIMSEHEIKMKYRKLHKKIKKLHKKMKKLLESIVEHDHEISGIKNREHP